MVFRKSLVEHEDVVHEADGTPLVDEVSEDIIHHGLERCWGVAEAEEHDKWFIQSTICPEGCLIFISLLNADIVETPLQVELGEVLGSSQSVQNVRDEWQWVGVLHRVMSSSDPCGTRNADSDGRPKRSWTSGDL